MVKFVFSFVICYIAKFLLIKVQQRVVSGLEMQWILLNICMLNHRSRGQRSIGQAYQKRHLLAHVSNYFRLWFFFVFKQIIAVQIWTPSPPPMLEWMSTFGIKGDSPSTFLWQQAAGFTSDCFYSYIVWLYTSTPLSNPGKSAYLKYCIYRLDVKSYARSGWKVFRSTSLLQCCFFFTWWQFWCALALNPYCVVSTWSLSHYFTKVRYDYKDFRIFFFLR